MNLIGKLERGTVLYELTGHEVKFLEALKTFIDSIISSPNIPAQRMELSRGRPGSSPASEKKPAGQAVRPYHRHVALKGRARQLVAPVQPRTTCKFCSDPLSAGQKSVCLKRECRAKMRAEHQANYRKSHPYTPRTRKSPRSEKPAAEGALGTTLPTSDRIDTIRNALAKANAKLGKS